MISMRKVAVLQSNYLPWKGYFDIIHDVDSFIFYDEVQYTKNDWRNRNKIYSPQGISWLTLPCGYDINRNIYEVKIKHELNWATDHWNYIKNAYAKASYFSKYRSFFEYVYLELKWEYLSELNHFLIKHIASECLGINTRFADSRDYVSVGNKSDKLLSLLLSIGCNEYVSGPAAKDYLDEALFNEKGIRVIWKDYSGYPEYKQMRLPFENNVSIVDLLMNTGDNAPYYIWGWREHQGE